MIARASARPAARAITGGGDKPVILTLGGNILTLDGKILTY